ncbi:MAG: glycosyltransferase family 39 protein [Candidatus Omnitrophica bacterium]|nr:glycosyltransferase family 39 protein [Candidatus Omnitrophota bacterium]MCM8790587.1 glycosyltransferase family 39 protein [Candidatus Omnitrophota bacterium]
MNIEIRNGGLLSLPNYAVLIILCIGSLILVMPTIGQNIQDPNMIVYFNADEGGLMDEIWYYYSGIKRDSFQWDFDYGLEMVYLAAFGRSILSKFIDLAPGHFVLILRFIHLVAWVLSLIALWRLIERHFGSGWQQVLPVALLATRPAFDYLSNSLKPEGLVLLFMMIGLDYTLRLIDSPSLKNIVVASAMAALAFIVKFAGLFLVPVVIVGLYLSKRCGKGHNMIIERVGKMSWVLPGICGLIIAFFPLLVLIFYTRKSTGLTWYAQYGLWGSIVQIPAIIYLIIIGAILIVISAALYAMTGRLHGRIKKIFDRINEINSYGLFSVGLFAGFVAIFGLKWIVNPRHLINIYGQFGPIAIQRDHAIAGIAAKGWLGYFFEKLADKILVFDPAILFLGLFYICVELVYWRKSFVADKKNFCKRATLLIFASPLFANLMFQGRFEQHNVLPFFAAASILAVQGVLLFNKYSPFPLLLKNGLLAFCIMVLLGDIAINGSLLAQARLYRFYQNEDVVFELAKWWRDTIPKEASVIAEHHSRVYIPPEQKNIKVLNWNGLDKANEMRRLVESHSPRYIYFKEEVEEKGGISSLEKLLPGRKTCLIKAFNSAGRRYQRHPNEKFVIYEVLY